MIDTTEAKKQISVEIYNNNYFSYAEYLRIAFLQYLLKSHVYLKYKSNAIFVGFLKGLSGSKPMWPSNASMQQLTVIFKKA